MYEFQEKPNASKKSNVFLELIATILIVILGTLVAIQFDAFDRLAQWCGKYECQWAR